MQDDRNLAIQPPSSVHPLLHSVRDICLALLLWPCIGIAFAQGSLLTPAQGHPLLTLTTMGAVHRLTPQQASQSYPVRVRGVLTFYAPYLPHPEPIVIVTDATGSVYVSLPGPRDPPLENGELLEVIGQTAAGDFGPVVNHAQIRILGPAPMPPRAPRYTLTRLLTGSEDLQWVEVEGVVESVVESGNDVTLQLALSDGEITAGTTRVAGVDYSRLVDAKILIRGNVGSNFTRQGQLVGVAILFPSLATVKIEQSPPQDPFALPIEPIAKLMTYDPARAVAHRTHVRGAVTLFWPGRLLCIQNDSAALCAATAQSSPLVLGGLADIVGFAQIGSAAATLTHAIYRANPVQKPVSISVINANQAFGGDYDGRLVQLDGRVIGFDRAAPDPTIILSSGKLTFSVVLPRSADSATLLALEEGSIVRVTGICAISKDSRVFAHPSPYPIVQYFQIMLRSGSDVVIVRRPSWWNVQHTLRVLALALVVTLCVLGWVVYLRLRLKKQTELLQHLATHDALTGLWNRAAVLERLERESEIVARARTTIGVIMLDADHFKTVNDTYGHHAGDAVLKEIAHRIQSALRSYDVTGRYGGEEFLIVLPSSPPEAVATSAERIRAAIAGDPISVDGLQLTVTVSVGTSILDPHHNTQFDALVAADKALYRAKRSGRNRVVSSGFETQPTPESHLV